MNATATQAPFHCAPIQDQIDALERAAKGQARYHAKCPNLDGRYIALEAYRLKSALHTLEEVKIKGIGA